MDVAVARNVACFSHLAARDGRGEPLIEHVARVAAAVPAEAMAVAWLHDVLERSPTSVTDLGHSGLTSLELAALRLLTREDSESYELHALRIAYAPGAAGRLARVVKLADIDDHIAQGWIPGAPPYEWARRHVAVGCARMDRRRETSAEVAA